MAGRLVIHIGLLAGAYYVVGRIGLELAYLDGAVAALWPPAGLGLAVLFRFGVRLWPGVVIGDLLLGDFSTPLLTVLAQTVGNTLAVVAGALLLRRLTSGRGGLERVGDVLALVGCALVTALVSAAFGPLALRLGDVIGAGELGTVFRTWTLGDAAGVLVVAPVILTWTAHGLPRAITRPRLAEGAVIAVLLVVLSELPPQRDVPYIVFPVLLWAALRFGPRGAAAAVLVVCSITVWNTAQNDGPFVRESITDSLLATQLFIALAAVTSLVLAAMTAELTRAEAAQRALAGEQAALRRVATLVAGDAEPSHVFERVTREVGQLLGVPSASIMRFDDAHTATVVGGWSEEGTPRFAVGERLDLDGDTVVAKVLRSGRAQRVERYDDTTGRLSDRLRGFGYTAAAAAPVRLGGRLWGALAAASAGEDRLPPGLEQRLCDFAELVAQALANADAYEKLAASRMRLVEAADAERRRLERNLHDGAQQRLLALALALERTPGTEAAQARVGAMRDELRRLAHGIHSVTLAEGGLGEAVLALVQAADGRVAVEALPVTRSSEAAEAAIYRLVAVVLRVAEHVHLAIETREGRLRADVRATGVDAATLTDALANAGARIAALGGELTVSGSIVRAVVPA